jgi:hypothetical protein
MTLKDIAKSFVVSHYDKIRSNVLSQHGKITQSAIPLGFVGETEVPVLKAILIFNTGFKQVNLTGDIGQNILASVQEACNQYMAETKLTREILARVKSGKDEIVSLLKGRQKIAGEDREEREELGYYIWESKKGWRPASFGDVMSIKRDKTIQLLLDEDGRIYVKGIDKTEFFKTKKVSFSLLKYFLKNKGSVYLNDVFEELKKIKKGINIRKRNVKRGVRNLNSVLKSKSIGIKNGIFFAEKDRAYIPSEVKICFIIRKEDKANSMDNVLF